MKRLWWYAGCRDRGFGKGGGCKLYNLTDLRPRLNKPDIVVHQIGGKPHIYWISLIAILGYCQSQSVQPTT